MELTEAGTHRVQRPDAGARNVNVGETERWLSAAGGGTLLLAGLEKRGLDGLLLALAGGVLVYRGATGYCPGYGALGVSTADRDAGNRSVARSRDRTLEIEASVTIQRSPEQVYRAWRDFGNHPRFARYIESVEVQSETRSRWIAQGPTGMTWEWEAEISQEREGEYIAWHTLPGADLPHRATARFERAPGDRGTELRIRFKIEPPGGVIGATIASYFEQIPERQLHDDLRRFKQLVEVGEIATTEGQPSGRK